jgi:ABC-type multidrug transport system fused ATPase/permease subunit
MLIGPVWPNRCAAFILIEGFANKRQELLLERITELDLNAAGLDGAAATQAGAERDREVQQLEDLHLNNRIKSKERERWRVIDPKDITVAEPVTEFVLLNTPQSVFVVSGGGRRGGGRRHKSRGGRLGPRAASSRNPARARARKVKRFVPKSGDAIWAAVTRSANHSMALSKRSEAITLESRRSRFKKLLQFVWSLVGTNKQRALMATSSALNFCNTVCRALHRHYQTSVLIQSVTVIGAAVVPQRLRGKGSTRPTVGTVAPLFDVLKITVMLKALSLLLGGLYTKVNEQGSRSIREMLAVRLQKHVLSQDLADIDMITKENEGRYGMSRSSPESILESLRNADSWRWGLGGIVLIPEELLTHVAELVSSVSILLGKSPQLVGVLYLVMVVQKLGSGYWADALASLTAQTGLDRPLAEKADLGQMDRWSLNSALRNFEDMRCNAKELEILSGLKRSDDLDTLQQSRQQFVYDLFEPVTDFIQGLPTLAVSYGGGLLASGGSMAVADLVGFHSSLTGFIDSSTQLYAELGDLYRLEDQRFEFGFNVMRLLETKPKIGLDNGWQPPPRDGDACNAEPHRQHQHPPPPQKGTVEVSTSSNASGLRAREGEDQADGRASLTSPLSPSPATSMPPSAPTPATAQAATPTLQVPGRRQLEPDARYRIGGEIEFRDVSFKYKGMRKSMLRHVSFKIKAGTFVGICGERGAGKTTMFKLLLRPVTHCFAPPEPLPRCIDTPLYFWVGVRRVQVVLTNMNWLLA